MAETVHCLSINVNNELCDFQKAHSVIFRLTLFSYDVSLQCWKGDMFLQRGNQAWRTMNDSSFWQNTTIKSVTENTLRNSIRSWVRSFLKHLISNLPRGWKFINVAVIGKNRWHEDMDINRYIIMFFSVSSQII